MLDIGEKFMWSTEGKPDDMPLEEWLDATGQHKPKPEESETETHELP